MVYAGAVCNIARRGTLEAILGKCLDCGIEQLLLRDDASLLLFSFRSCGIQRQSGRPRIAPPKSFMNQLDYIERWI